MLNCEHIKQIIEECREIGDSGLKNGVNASIPTLEIDIVKSPHDFLGVNGNPAIFVNRSTFKFLGMFHRNWVVNRTIALKEGFLEQVTINVIGAIIHETGHAFNVAAKIENSETNAYIFEIEVMLKLLETNSPLLFGCVAADVKEYFKERLFFYKKGIGSNKHLASLVEEINEQFNLEQKMPPTKKDVPSLAPRYTLFKQKQWKRELEIILSKMDVCVGL